MRGPKVATVQRRHGYCRDSFKSMTRPQEFHAAYIRRRALLACILPLLKPAPLDRDIDLERREGATAYNAGLSIMRRAAHFA